MANDKDWPPELRHYTEQQWQHEMDAGGWIGPYFLGTTIPCPDCGSFGFYGPRQEPPPPAMPITRKYRACKFCGFWQEAMGQVLIDHGPEPYRCNHFSCDKCGAYGWRSPWNKGNEVCPNCKVDMSRVKWPTEDSSHPFHAIRERIVQALNP